MYVSVCYVGAVERESRKGIKPDRELRKRLKETAREKFVFLPTGAIHVQDGWMGGWVDCATYNSIVVCTLPLRLLQQQLF